jgi:hypothetical protein
MKITRKTSFLTVIACAIFFVLAAAAAGAEDKSAIAKYWKESGKSYPASGKFAKAAKWAPGQYVIVGTTTKGKHESVSRSLIVRQEADGWVIETTNTDRKGKETASQMLLKHYDEAIKAGNPKLIEIGWMKMRDEDGNIQTIDGDQMALFNTFAKSSYENLIVNIETYADGGDVAVPGGSFSGCTYNKASLKVMGMKVTTEEWFHPSVPVNGMVKSQTEDGKSVTELLSFGYDGKPSIE